jgi:hypothetical protein
MNEEIKMADLRGGGMGVGIGRSFICEKELLAQLVTELDGSTLRDGEVDRVVCEI